MKVFLAVLIILFAAQSLRADPLGPRPVDAPSPASAANGQAPIQAAVEQYRRMQAATAVMIVQDGRVMASAGDVTRKVNLRSVRKSLISALYGIAVADGLVRLDATLAELGIDDTEPKLTPTEKAATVRDLLMARSGVYHAAAYETADMGEKRPERGRHAPGTFWFYNNWDFNALGTIYGQVTGEDIFASFERRVARPIGMEDFSASDGRTVREPKSVHAAYPFSLSARDAARFGLLYLNEGRWAGRQVVPASWVKESTRAYSQTDRPGQGYGYLWWTLPSGEWGDGAFLASGYGGQSIVVAPAKRLVAVQTAAGGGIRTSAFLDLLQSVAQSLP